MQPVAATDCLPNDLAGAGLVGRVWRSLPRPRHRHPPQM